MQNSSRKLGIMFKEHGVCTEVLVYDKEDSS